MIPSSISRVCGLALALGTLALAHSGGGGHEHVPVPDDADWATRHMAEEHHISTFDAGSFFALHDFENAGVWHREDILRTYGLDDESLADVSKHRRDEIVMTVMALLDKDGNGEVSRDEWMRFTVDGGKLPDFGLGPGHHGDDEYEYEIHHFEKYHDENTKEEDLTHPEDIAHFKKHEEQEAAQAAQDKMDKLQIIEANIPQKFRIKPEL